MRSLFIFCLVGSLKIISHLFFRMEQRWIRTPPPEPWERLRVVAILNHTSLYEWLFAASVPWRFIRRLAWHGVVPVADKTIRRPIIGRFYKLIARHVVSITRKRDQTWQAVLDSIESEAMVLLLPEGRMMRAGGLDAYGKPMTVRGGIADVIQAIPDGRILLAYSGGLHHVQHPGEHFPRLFKTIRINFETLELADYREEIRAHGGDFRRAVRQDLERRRDEYSPPATPYTGKALPAPLAAEPPVERSEAPGDGT